MVRVGYFVSGDIIIAVDLFSQKEGSMKEGEIRELRNDIPINQQIYEALSGNKWDEAMERLFKKFEEEDVETL